MKLQNIHGFSNIDAYVQHKLSVYGGKEKTFETLFELMFDETDNIMVETTDGYRVSKVTYGAFKQNILAKVPGVAAAFAQVEPGSMIGLYMANSSAWLEMFWAILAAGYSPLLMNTRLADGVLNGILAEYHVQGVISDGKRFSALTVLADQLPETGELMPARPFGKEVLFMSSGTTDHVKLCAYTGENFYYQICASADIIADCPDIKRHYQGELKQLVLLPLCHVFGFIAVYLWFGFFARTFVFPRDLNPVTIQRTVKKHKVTHIFAVPMVWDGVAKAARAKIRTRGEKTYRRFCRVSNLVNALGHWGDPLAKRLLKEVREGLFGDSILFMISGGSQISQSTLSFFNGIGYHLANGYGMTEIGITSVETARSKKLLNSGSIGAPFGNTEYALDADGKLLVRGRTRASRILCDGEQILAEEGQWFITGDMMRCKKGRYYAQGRADDLIICQDGENLNPVLAEAALKVAGVDQLCVFVQQDNTPALIASAPGCYSQARLEQLDAALSAALVDAKLDKVIRRVYITHEALLAPGEFKLSRKKLAQRIQDGQLSVIDPKRPEAHRQELLEGVEKDLRNCFAQVLNKDPETIGKDSHFFRDLEGTSLDYYTLLGMIQTKFGVQVENNEGMHLATVSEFAAYLQNK